MDAKDGKFVIEVIGDPFLPALEEAQVRLNSIQAILGRIREDARGDVS
ncbi:MAG: hypothetical protein QXG25_02630 [Nitrososphaerota archaeon]